MRSTCVSAPLGRGPRTVLTATGLVAALVLTATACGGSGKDDKPDATVSRAAGSDGEVRVPSGMRPVNRT